MNGEIPFDEFFIIEMVDYLNGSEDPNQAFDEIFDHLTAQEPIPEDINEELEFAIDTVLQELNNEQILDLMDEVWERFLNQPEQNEQPINIINHNNNNNNNNNNNSTVVFSNYNMNGSSNVEMTGGKKRSKKRKTRKQKKAKKSRKTRGRK